MRLNFFSRNRDPEPNQEPSKPADTTSSGQTPPSPHAGKTFPADEIVWGIAIRNGYDEIDDPLYHRGTTQHAYLEGNDNVAICGFRPPQSGPRTRRRSRLGLPTAGEHPMCGMCARMVVAPRPRVPVPVQPGRPPVAVPVTGGVRAGAPGTNGSRALIPAGATPAPAPAAQPKSPSPWVQQRVETHPDAPRTISIELGTQHDGGLLERGVHATLQDEGHAPQS